MPSLVADRFPTDRTLAAARRPAACAITPEEVVRKASEKYLEAYSKITGSTLPH